MPGKPALIIIQACVLIRGMGMNALTHRFGLELDFTLPESGHPDHRNELETKISRNKGIVFAEFSKEHPNIIVIDYDPTVTSPDEILKKAKLLNLDIKRKVFL